MRDVLTVLRLIAGFCAGVIAAVVVITLARELAFGDGFGISPANLAIGAQAIVVAGYCVGGAIGAWLANTVAGSTAPAIVVCAWLFQAAWLSPAMRPTEVTMRLICALALALGGFAAFIAYRERAGRRTTSHQASLAAR